MARKELTFMGAEKAIREGETVEYFYNRVPSQTFLLTGDTKFTLKDLSVIIFYIDESEKTLYEELDDGELLFTQRLAITKANKKFIEWLKINVTGHNHPSPMEDKAKEIYGDELI